jgi:histidine triad (HIT) family protein
MNLKGCVFCRIVAGKREAYMVYQDRRFMAFLDSAPRTKGHTLVVPRRHFRWVVEIPAFGDYCTLARRVALAAKQAFDADWIQFLTIGEAVAHAHIHVLPRYAGDGHGAIVSLGKVASFSPLQMRDIAQDLHNQLAQEQMSGPPGRTESEREEVS